MGLLTLSHKLLLCNKFSLYTLCATMSPSSNLILLYQGLINFKTAQLKYLSSRHASFLLVFISIALENNFDRA
jgi:hypothetical protein